MKTSEIVSFYEDENVVDKMINLLNEGKSTDKIKGIISSTEIVKYGGDISDEEVEELYQEIIEWWKEKMNTPPNTPHRATDNAGL